MRGASEQSEAPFFSLECAILSPAMSLQPLNTCSAAAPVRMHPVVLLPPTCDVRVKSLRKPKSKDWPYGSFACRKWWHTQDLARIELPWHAERYCACNQ